MFDEKEGQTHFCQQCEDLQSQIARLHGYLNQLASIIPEGFVVAQNTVNEALSETADNDKWLAERDARTLENAGKKWQQLHVFPDAARILIESADELRNQSKKG